MGFGKRGERPSFSFKPGGKKMGAQSFFVRPPQRSFSPNPRALLKPPQIRGDPPCGPPKGENLKGPQSPGKSPLKKRGPNWGIKRKFIPEKFRKKGE